MSAFRFHRSGAHTLTGLKPEQTMASVGALCTTLSFPHIDRNVKMYGDDIYW